MCTMGCLLCIYVVRLFWLSKLSTVNREVFTRDGLGSAEATINFS